MLDILIANGCRIEIAETVRRGHAEMLARDAAAKGARLVVAAGGDGTIAEVANGLTGSAAKLGIIPLGTANVLAHELALPFVPQAVAAALAFGRTRPLWPGLARRSERARLFVQMLSVGFDAAVVHRVSIALKRMLGWGAYVYQTLRELPRYRFDPIRLVVDGEKTQAAGVIISKGALYGGPFLLAPRAEPAEQGFSVVLFDWKGPAAALMYGAALPLNLLARAPGIRRLRAARIDFANDQPFLAQSDGDTVPWMPSSVADAPEPINIVVAP